MSDIVFIDTDLDLFGDEISGKPKVDREAFADLLFNLVRDLSVEEFAALFVNTIEAATDYVSLCSGERTGQRISLLFNPHRLDTTSKASPVSLYRRLSDRSFCDGLARVMLLKKDRVKNLLYASVELGVNGATFINEFPPYVARDMALEYSLSLSSKVLDPCAGWGGRMIGFSTVVNEYTCFEPSVRSAAGLRKLSAFVQGFRKPFSAQVNEMPFEESSLADSSFDLALTSPPYYDTERYAPEETTNSCNRYPTFTEWCEGFYEPLIHKTLAALKPDAPFLLNIGSRVYPLNTTLLRICDGRYRVTKRGHLSGVAGYGKTGEGETFYEIRR